MKRTEPSSRRGTGFARPLPAPPLHRKGGRAAGPRGVVTSEFQPVQVPVDRVGKYRQVGRDDGRAAVVQVLLQQFVEHRGAAPVERGRGLVEQPQRASRRLLRGERETGQHQALLLALREPPRRDRRLAGNAGGCEGRAQRSGRRVEAVEGCGQGEVLERGEFALEARRVPLVEGVPAKPAAAGREVFTGEAQPAGSGRQAEQGAQQARLAAAVRTLQQDHLARREREGELVQQQARAAREA